MFRIQKEFNFCYGHRVWNQQLEPMLALDTSCKCRHLHGHEGKIEIELMAPNLKRGMVTDFKHLNWLKEWLDTVVDHKFIIDSNDPLFPTLTMGYAVAHNSDGYGTLIYPAPNLENEFPFLPTGHLVAHQAAMRELLDGFVVVGFVPTSENLAKWLFAIASGKLRPWDIKVSKVVWWETPKSCSTYEHDLYIRAEEREYGE